MVLEATITWVLMYHAECGPLGFLAGAPLCWRDLSQSGYVYQTEKECDDVRDNPPAGGTFKCEERATFSNNEKK